MFLETSQRHISQAEDVASLLDSVGVPKAKVRGGAMAWFHRCFLRELGGCNGRVWAKTVVDFRLLMIFGWGGIMGGKTTSFVTAFKKFTWNQGICRCFPFNYSYNCMVVFESSWNWPKKTHTHTQSPVATTSKWMKPYKRSQNVAQMARMARVEVLGGQGGEYVLIEQWKNLGCLGVI